MISYTLQVVCYNHLPVPYEYVYSIRFELEEPSKQWVRMNHSEAACTVYSRLCTKSRAQGLPSACLRHDHLRCLQWLQFGPKVSNYVVDQDSCQKRHMQLRYFEFSRKAEKPVWKQFWSYSPGVSLHDWSLINQLTIKTRVLVPLWSPRTVLPVQRRKRQKKWGQILDGMHACVLSVI